MLNFQKELVNSSVDYGKIVCRGCTKEYFPKLVHYIIGIKDVRVSLRESLVDLIVETR